MEHIPKISVVMPVWNGGKYVREAIDSILNQTFSDFEFIIIDDGSTDQTIEIIESYDDPRIRLFKREHEGIVSALNFGVEHARADWIARQDADDLSHPRRFEWQWKKIGKTGAILCYGRSRVIHQTGSRVKGYIPATQALLKLMLCFGVPVPHTSVLFCKQTFFTVGGYLEEECHAEDFGLWGRMVLVGKTARTRQKIVSFRRHNESISFNCGDIQSQLAKQLRVKHCTDFWQVSEERAIEILEELGRGSPVIWIRFMQQYVRRSKDRVGVELWAWILFVALKLSVRRAKSWLK